MDAPEHAPVSQKTPKLTTFAATNISAEKINPRNTFLALRLVARPYRWFQHNTFTPNFLTGAWANLALGYLVALVLQLLVSIAILGLVHFFPSFRFPAVPLILVILLVALGWGAGPSIVALLIGAVLLIFFVLPPIFSLSINQSEDVIGIILYLAVGLTISIFASNIERVRRKSEELSLRLNAIIDAIPDSLTIYDAQGNRIQQNRVAREKGPEQDPPMTLAQLASQFATRRSSGELLPLDELPIARALRGEVVTGAELLFRSPVKGQDQLVAASAAPLYSPSGKTIEGAIGITHDLSERKQIEDDLRASQEQEHLLAEVSKILASTLDYRETLANIARLIVPQLADWFAVDLVDAEGNFELIEIDHKDPEQVKWVRALRERYPIDPDASTGAPNVVRTGQAEFYPEITDEMLVAGARNEEELALTRQIGSTSIMLVPLIVRGKTIGVVTFVSTEFGRKYDARDLALAEEIGRRAGVALDNARLYQEAQKTRDQLSIILQGVADGIVVWDKEDHVIYSNAAAARLTGYEAEPGVMETPRPAVYSRFEFFDEQRRLIPHSLLPHRRVFAGEAEAQATIGYRDPLSDQSERWAILQARPVYDEHGEVVNAIAILHDITERKAEDEARRLLAAIVVSSNDAIIGKTIDGIVTSWNAAAEKMYGYTSGEIVGQSIALLFSPDQQGELATIMAKIKKGESVGPYDTTRRKKDGSTLTVSVTVSPVKDVTGIIVGASAIARDISERKRLEAELWRSKQQLEVIFANIADGISVQDRHGKLIFMNDAGAKRSGYLSAADALGTAGGRKMRTHAEQRFEILDERGNPLSYEELPGKRALRGEKAPQAVVQYFDKATQTRQWSLVKARPLFDATGQVELAITIFSDVTETYEEQQRKDEFISMASHELKTPVTSLKGFAQVLQRRLQKQGDEQGLHYATRMDAQLNKLTKLVSDLLDVSRMQAGKLTFDIEPFELDALVLETVENVQVATPGHQLLVEGRTGGCVLGDKDRLGQVFINLLTNAVKYSPQAEKVIVHLSRNSQEAGVSVQDFGIGIDAAHHQKIFERFYQVTEPEEKTFPGLGMGLYISHEIVQRHQGRMWVESTKGEGSTFSVALPLLQEDS